MTVAFPVAGLPGAVPSDAGSEGLTVGEALPSSLLAHPPRKSIVPKTGISAKMELAFMTVAKVPEIFDSEREKEIARPDVDQALGDTSFAAPGWRNAAMISSAAAIQMQESATLKEGKCPPEAGKSFP